MAYITWTDTYSVSVKRCDQEHQKLFDLINTLHDAMRQGKGNDVSAKIVKELASYTKFHFAAEEALMKKANYQKLPAHQQQHQQFIAEVEKLETNLAGGRAVNLVSLLGFLRDWLAKHIMQTDKDYSAHLNSAGIN